MSLKVCGEDKVRKESRREGKDLRTWWENEEAER
jgi:hypothetical protein